MFVKLAMMLVKYAVLNTMMPAGGCCRIEIELINQRLQRSHIGVANRAQQHLGMLLA